MVCELTPDGCGYGATLIPTSIRRISTPQIIWLKSPRKVVFLVLTPTSYCDIELRLSEFQRDAK